MSHYISSHLVPNHHEHNTQNKVVPNETHLKQVQASIKACNS